jgi:hypothetical protein
VVCVGDEMAKKATGSKSKPKLTGLRKQMKKTRDDLAVIISQKKDQKGPLTQQQLTKAKKTKKALDSALRDADCVQSQGSY